MSDVKLGELIKAGLNRDAIHCAVMPMMAGEDLVVGAHVGLKRGTDLAYHDRAFAPYVGIVDPFLSTMVRKGQWFYMLLYPGTTVNLRHNWDHPAIMSEEDRAERENRGYRSSYDEDDRDRDDRSCAC